MAFVAAAGLGMELLEVIGGVSAVAEAAADVTAAAEAIAMETGMAEAIPLMETAVGRTATGEAVREFAAYSTAARASGIARALGASGVTAAGVAGAVAARSFGKVLKKAQKLTGKRKRGDDEGTSSLLPAHPTRPSLPSGPASKAMPGKKTSSKRARRATKVRKKPAKPVKRKSSKKKTTKKVRKGPAKQLLATYETHGIIQRDNVSYFGFQNHGGRDELFRSAMESVLNTLLRKFRIQKRSPDEVLQIAQSVPAVDKIRIKCRKRNYGTGEDDGSVSDDFDLNGATYATLLDTMTSTLKARVEAGHFPFNMTAYNNGGTADSNEVMRDVKFGDCKLSLGVSMRIKLRNITPNDGDGTDRFALDTNPLQGYLYKFSGDCPVVREGLYGSHEGPYARFHDREATSGLLFGPQRNALGDHDGAPSAAGDIMGANKILSVPPRNGKKVWTNCVSSVAVAFAPGQAVEHKMKYTYNGTLINFLMKFYQGVYSAPKIGVTHWLGLEQKFKQKTKAASGAEGTSVHDHVVMEYDLDVKHSGGASFAAAAQAPRSVITRAGHNSV